jgi:hypothetical protein
MPGYNGSYVVTIQLRAKENHTEQKAPIFPVSVAIHYIRIKVSGGVAFPPLIICISIVLLLIM